MSERIIQSELWKAAQLRYHSTYFPTLVRAACDQVGTPYSDEVLEKIASNTTIRGLFAITVDTGIDAAIITAMSDTDTAKTLDDAIIWVVTEHKKTLDS